MSHFSFAVDAGADAMRHCLSFLYAHELVQLGLCSRATFSLTSSNHIWESILENELGVTRATLPPSDIPIVSDTNSRSTYMVWRRSFHEYCPAEIKLALRWWNRIECWLEQNAPTIRTSLNPPATVEAINLAESILRRKIPRALKLLYRFHNGQHLPFDELKFHGRIIGNRFDIHSSVHGGLFGGYSYYDQQLNMRFLTLEQMLALSSQCPPMPLLARPPAWRNGRNWISSPQTKDKFNPFEYYCTDEANRIAPFVFSCNAMLSGFLIFYGIVEGNANMAVCRVTNFGMYVHIFLFLPCILHRNIE